MPSYLNSSLSAILLKMCSFDESELEGKEIIKLREEFQYGIGAT